MFQQLILQEIYIRKVSIPQRVIRICKSKRNRQRNGQKKNRLTIIIKPLHRKLRIEKHESHQMYIKLILGNSENKSYRFRFMVFNATFNNISVIYCGDQFIGGGNRSTRRKQATCRKSLTNFISCIAYFICYNFLYLSTLHYILEIQMSQR